MEVHISKLQENVGLILERDKVDCENKLLTGYLKTNLRVYANTRGNSNTKLTSEVDLDELQNGERIAKYTRERNYSLPPLELTSRDKRKARLTGGNKNDCKMTARNSPLSNVNTDAMSDDSKQLDRPLEFSTVDYKQTSDNKRNTLSRKKKRTQNLLKSANVSMLSYHSISLDSMTLESLPSDRGYSARPNSVAENVETFNESCRLPSCQERKLVLTEEMKDLNLDSSQANNKLQSHNESFRDEKFPSLEKNKYCEFVSKTNKNKSPSCEECIPFSEKSDRDCSIPLSKSNNDSLCFDVDLQFSETDNRKIGFVSPQASHDTHKLNDNNNISYERQNESEDLDLDSNSEENINSQSAKKDREDTKIICQDGSRDCSIFHLTNVLFEQFPEHLHNRQVTNALEILDDIKCKNMNSTAPVDVEAIMNFRPGTQSRITALSKSMDEIDCPLYLPTTTTTNGKKRIRGKPICIPLKHEKPVLLKMHHRQDKFINRKRETHEEGRLLPTTLSGLKRGGYSVMTPYMASVVWSIMEDESVDKSRDLTFKS